MNEGIHNKHKKKISLVEFFIPLFCLINQYKIAGINLGLLCVITVVSIYFIRYREFYLYKPLFVFFIFMIIHDFFRMFITGFNSGLWIERTSYLLILSCIYKNNNEENLFRVWKLIGIIVMAGIFYQSFQVYILGQSVSTINIFPFLQSNSENYLLSYDRPHSFFLEPAVYSTWILPFLCMCMKRKKHIWMIFISISILLSTSSTGILMTGVIWIFYVFINFRNEKKYFNTLMIVGGLIIGIVAFLNLNIFSIALNKLINISVTNTSNSVRLVLGFQLFWATPIIYKFLGIPYMNVENYMRSGEVTLSKYKLSINLPYLGFVNAIGNCMLVYGIFGLFLYLKLFLNIWKESDLYSKCYVLTCIISIFGQSVFWNSLFVTQFAVMLCSVERTSFVRVMFGKGATCNLYE
ncbi:hypothetical protein [Lachnoanaerobaculum sp. OBRC5-5]|uniref:hypothetical protein n=1 Tax=Lachnoanaerobaculum sp. OBRC5-5 TaxID=936595 RepID=UPI00028256B1|nr:hypothetical protein [Lachnoanaerobaculum sp. OBRC5-5]EJZ70195.1 hypothetical protein HMPREF1135_01031 [Lachnoanaerobaculum sp. OBRC5-5]